MDDNDLEHWFTYHPPTETQAAMYRELRHQGLALAGTIHAMAPDSEEKKLAMVSLRQAVMWANAAIACGLAHSS